MDIRLPFCLFILYLSLLHNDFQIQPLNSMAAWDRRLNPLFPIQSLLTFIYINVSCGLIQARFRIKSLKNSFSINSSRPFRFATTSKDCA